MRLLSNYRFGGGVAPTDFAFARQAAYSSEEPTAERNSCAVDALLRSDALNESVEHVARAGREQLKLCCKLNLPLPVRQIPGLVQEAPGASRYGLAMGLPPNYTFGRERRRRTSCLLGKPTHRRSRSVSRWRFRRTIRSAGSGADKLRVRSVSPLIRAADC